MAHTMYTELFKVTRMWRPPSHPYTSRWMKQTQYLDAIEYYLPGKKNEILSLAGKQMELEDMLSEYAKQKDKYYIFPFTHEDFFKKAKVDLRIE